MIWNLSWTLVWQKMYKRKGGRRDKKASAQGVNVYEWKEGRKKNSKKEIKGEDIKVNTRRRKKWKESDTF